MNIRIPSQRQKLVDKQGLTMTEWFRFFTDLMTKGNNRSVLVGSPGSAKTSDTDETTIATLSQLTGQLQTLTIATSCTSNANAKTVRVKMGTTALLTLSLDNNTDSQSATIQLISKNAGFYVEPLALRNMTASGGGYIAANSAILFTFQLGDAADTMTLESYALTAESQ